jgi:hypothetical protein
VTPNVTIQVNPGIGDIMGVIRDNALSGLDLVAKFGPLALAAGVVSARFISAGRINDKISPGDHAPTMNTDPYSVIFSSPVIASLKPTKSDIIPSTVKGYLRSDIETFIRGREVKIIRLLARNCDSRDSRAKEVVRLLKSSFLSIEKTSTVPTNRLYGVPFNRPLSSLSGSFSRSWMRGQPPVLIPPVNHVFPLGSAVAVRIASASAFYGNWFSNLQRLIALGRDHIPLLGSENLTHFTRIGTDLKRAGASKAQLEADRVFVLIFIPLSGKAYKLELRAYPITPLNMRLNAHTLLKGAPK